MGRNTTLLVVVAAMMMSACAAAAAIALYLANRDKEPETQAPEVAAAPVLPEEPPEQPPEQPPPKNEKKSATSGAWKKATATFYHSYPPCCKDSPTYDAGASKSECSDYSGCKWMGQFAAVGKKDHDWVKQNDIVAFFETGGAGSWKSKWANKTITIRNPSSGKEMDVLIADTCGDGDCGGCCTQNANKHGGTLIDLEYYTAKRFWGDKVEGMAEIEWRGPA